MLHARVYRSFATRVSQLNIWHFWVIGIERNVRRCTLNRYSVITQFAKLAAGEQLCRCFTHRKLRHFKTFKSFSWKITHFELCDTVVANERYVHTHACTHTHTHTHIRAALLPPSSSECVGIISLNQRFSNFFQVGTTFISQNVLRTTLLLGLSNSLGLP